MRAPRNDDPLTRHAVGRIFADVCADELRYGRGAPRVFAAAIGKDIKTLYKWAQVAEAWSERELAALLARRTKGGVPLSWSHLVALAALAPKERRAWTTRTLEEDLSVRELARGIDEASPHAGARVALLAGGVRPTPAPRGGARSTRSEEDPAPSRSA